MSAFLTNQDISKEALMFKLFDRNHNAVDILDGYKNCYIEETLKTGLKTLSFSISSTHPLASKIEEEGYLQTAD